MATLPMLLYAKKHDVWTSCDAAEITSGANLFGEIECKKKDILMFSGVFSAIQ